GGRQATSSAAMTASGLPAPPKGAAKPYLFGAEPLLGKQASKAKRHHPKGAEPEPALGKLASRAAAVGALIAGALMGAACAGAGAMLLTSRGAPSAETRMERRADHFPTGQMVRLDIAGRGLWVYKPNSSAAGGERLPLVMVLHGSEDTALNIANVSGFAAVAENVTDGFILAFPEMVKERADSWDFGAPHEVGFFRAAVHLLHSKGLVRREKVFVCGHSNGGTMALFLQNNLPDVFSGAAAVEAGVGHLEQWKNLSYGSPTMVIWNHNDNVLQEFGGEKLYHDTLATLRRHDPYHSHSEPASRTRLDAGSGGSVRYAERLLWRATSEGLPPLMVVSWGSELPSH
ncbi:unnamed protein product, partial [Prorocentrum cordatum]